MLDWLETVLDYTELNKNDVANEYKAIVELEAPTII